MYSERKSGGCLMGVLVPLFGAIIIGFWPLIFFSHLPWILRVPAWVLWLIFLGSGLTLAWRKFSSNRPFHRGTPRYIRGDLLQVSPEEAFLLLEDGFITPYEYNDYLAYHGLAEY